MGPYSGSQLLNRTLAFIIFLPFYKGNLRISNLASAAFPILLDIIFENMLPAVFANKLRGLSLVGSLSLFYCTRSAPL